MSLPVLALDLATKTGWALKDRKGRVLSGVQEFSLKRGESPGMRFLRFRKWLADILSLNEMTADFQPPGLVAYEQAHHRGAHATQLALGLTTDVLAEAAHRSLEHMAVHTATLKKWATGDGRAGKPKMIEKAQSVYPGIEIIDDNHADALLLLAYTLDQVH